jgi:hypothetical protein
MDLRNEAFQRLKPTCVALSQAAIGLMGSQSDLKTLSLRLKDLVEALKLPIVRSALDEKLADYIFFPLSNVLRHLEKLPVRSREWTFEAILVLLKTAWKNKINTQLGTQLMILLSIVLDPKSTDGKLPETSEELQMVAYRSLGQLLESMGKHAEGREALTATANVPQIGQIVSVIVVGMVKGESEAIQQAAIEALKAFCIFWPDQTSLSMNFFPGTISALVKVLNAKPSEKRTTKTLTDSLEVAGLIICKVLGDDSTKSLPAKNTSSTPELDKTWLKATSAQVKIALSNILKLRSSERAQLLQALGGFCMRCIDECWESLSDSRSMLVETISTISVRDERIKLSLKSLIASNDVAKDIVQSMLYQAVVSLPRMAMSADDNVRQKALDQISLLYKLLSEQGSELAVVQAILPAHIRDAVVSSINEGTSKISEEALSILPTQELVNTTRTKSTRFAELMLTKSSQHTIEAISQFLVGMSALPGNLTFAKDLLAMLPDAKGNERLSISWIVLQMLRNGIQYNQGLVSFGDEELEDLLEQFYSFSLQTLSDDGPIDWRLQAITLEAIAMNAAYHGEEFRIELVDCLYPVVQLMGSSDTALQNHAVICLNIMAKGCIYNDTGEMIIQNADYLVNAIGIRLNTFDLSPQGPHVLIMMITLAGPSLLPYLDDLIESIFTALESFHGYQKLTELLFAALKAVVDQGITLPHLALEHGANPLGDKLKVKPTSTEQLAEVFQIRSETAKAQSKLKISAHNDTPGHVDDIHTEGVEAVPAPQTFGLLLKIAELAQYHLTSPSLQLRIMILSLLKSAIPAVSLHEDSFLPLINKLWPVLLPRLRDPETQVVAGTLDVITQLVRYSGSFMSSRMLDAWPEIRALYTRLLPTVPRVQLRIEGMSIKDRPAASSGLIQSLYYQPNSIIPRQATRMQHESPTRQLVGSTTTIMSSLMGFLGTIADSMTLRDQTFDEILEMLAPVLEKRSEIRQILQERNPDAVWLALYRHGRPLSENVVGGQAIVSDNIDRLQPPQASRWKWAEVR